MVNALGIGGIAVTGVTLLLGILSTAIVHWATYSLSSTIEVKFGLFKSCSETSGTKTCSDTEFTNDDTKESQLNAMKAMMIMGILLSVAALACGIVVVFVMKQLKVVYFAAGGVAIGAGFCYMIGMAIFADKLYEDTMDYGACFALAIVAWILAWVAGALFIVTKIMDKNLD